MDKTQTFTNFLVNQSAEISFLNFTINLVLATLLSFLLAFIYVKFGNSLSNRKLFSKNLIFLTMTTMLVISIVKSSLALSLGLVGALSIVRFRAAIKEPEELAYLFLAIAIGLGFGANQGGITAFAFVIMTSVVVGLNYYQKKDDHQNLHLTVFCNAEPKMTLGQVVDVLKQNCSKVLLKRFDEDKNSLSSTFLVEFDDAQNLEKTQRDLQELNNSVKVTYMDSRGVI